LNNSEKEKVIATYGNPYSEFVICIQPIQISAHTLGVVSSEHTLPTVNTHPNQRGATFTVAPEE